MSSARASSTTRDLAERLLAYEAALDRTLQGESSDTCHVCEKLRRSLERLLGADAYTLLVARALGFAKLEVPILQSVQVRANGSIEGLTGEAINGNGILIAHLIGLMETFIGETVTLWLLDDVWPTLPGPRIKVRGNEPMNQPVRETGPSTDS
jgi:hypothetical protein